MAIGALSEERRSVRQPDADADISEGFDHDRGVRAAERSTRTRGGRIDTQLEVYAVAGRVWAAHAVGVGWRLVSR